MDTTRTLFFAAGSSLLALAGCTLTGVDRFPLPECSSTNDCEILNTRDHIAADACSRWSCVAPGMGRRTCTFGKRDADGDGDPAVACGGTDCDEKNKRRVGDPHNPAYAETCDGIDNNCDGTVDEKVIQPTVTNLVSTSSQGNAFSAAHAAAPNNGLAIGMVDFNDRTAQVVVAGLNMPNPLRPVAYATQTMPANINGAADDMLNQAKCPATTGLAGCNVAEMALEPADPARDMWLGAAINTSGCAAGQLRIGVLRMSTGAYEIRGPVFRSNVFEGVDVSATSACTGASNPAETSGAMRPSAAVLASAGGASATGVVAFIQASAPERTTPPDATLCRTTAQPVKAIGVYLESDTLTGPVGAWFEGTNNGLPQSLGTTLATVSPAILALNSAPNGFVEAHPSVDGKISLSFINTLPTLAPANTSMLSTNGMMPRVTQPMQIVGNLAIPANNATNIALARGHNTATGKLEVGVVWREGCAITDGAIWFTVVSLDPATPASSTFVPPVKLSDHGDKVSVSYLESGFLSPAVDTPPGSPPAANSGGFFALWSQNVAGTWSVNGARLGATPPYAKIDDGDLNLSADQRGPATITDPFAVSDNSTAAPVFSFRNPTAWFYGNLVCATPSP